MSMQFKSERRFICLKAIEFKRIVFGLNAGKICKRRVKLYPTNNLRYQQFYFIRISRIIIVCNQIIAIIAQIKIHPAYYLELIFQVTSFFLRFMNLAFTNFRNL